MDTWKQRLKARMDELGLSGRALSKAAGLSPSFVSDIFTKDSSPSVDALAKICFQLGLTVSQLYEGGTGLDPVVEVLGTAAGEEWRPSQAGDAAPLVLDIFSKDLVWLRVQGPLLLPHYSDGEVIGGPRIRPSGLDNYVGRDVIAETVAGEKIVRILARGATKGRFTLRSFNSRAEDLANVQLKFAAPIQIILRDV
jgi:transcriptional regulator with XRE-family HTH domain